NGFALVLAQSDMDAERLTALGASNVCASGNLKYDIRVAQPATVTEILRAHLPIGAKVVVCGSTVADEEELLVRLLPLDVITILAPRHPERFSAVAAMLTDRGVKFVRRSEWLASPSPLSAGMFFLLDSIGELASAYCLASVAVVGGGMLAPGGHNPLEPAQFGVAVVMGPHYENFRGIVEKLRAENAIVVARVSALPEVLRDLLSDEESSRAMGARARAVFEREAGATARAVTALVAVLQERA
ncbi:MAG: 3-deoxy-D-manno-octulosonic acid transferase, partial [Silvibacterium sp.]